MTPATGGPARPGRHPPDPRPAVVAAAPGVLEALVERLGHRPFHARQMRRAVLRRGVTEFSAMTDLPAVLRDAMTAEARTLTSRVEREQVSSDGTRKLLIRLEDGETVETVVIPEGRRVTTCLSTEVGCPVRCAFCASGLLGLRRPLAAHEIVEQAVHARAAARAGGATGLTHVVLMGMGEPLLNYGPTIAAVTALRDPEGLGIGARRITLSTVGIVEGMDRLAAERHPINLAVSLHAPDDETRTRLIPLNARYGVAAVVAAARRYAATTRRDVTFEYVLLGGVTDSLAQARSLGALAGDAHLNVNLIPWNEVSGTGFRAPEARAVEAFAAELRRRGIPVHVRRRRGADIDAACGQLRLEESRRAASG